MTLKQRLITLSATHPGYTKNDAAAALACHAGSVSGYSSELGLKWMPAPRKVVDRGRARFRRVERIKANIGAAT